MRANRYVFHVSTVLALIIQTKANSHVLRAEAMENKVNLVYALDASDNTGEANFNLLKQYVIDDAKIRLNNAGRYGAMQIGAVVGWKFLHEIVYMESDLTSFAVKLKDIPFRGGFTDNNKGLTMGLSLFEAQPPSEKNILLVLTSGNSEKNPEMIKSTGKSLKNFNVSTYAIGIGDNVSKEELRAIIGADLSQRGDELAASHIRYANNFTNLPTVDISQAMLVNVALGKPADQSSVRNITLWNGEDRRLEAGLAVDGNANTDPKLGSCSGTFINLGRPIPHWWQVDLGALYRVHAVTITTPRASSINESLTTAKLIVKQNFKDNCIRDIECVTLTAISMGATETHKCKEPITGRYLKLENSISNTCLHQETTTVLTLCEVEVLAESFPLRAPQPRGSYSRCQPDAHGVRTFYGKPCASTTRYNDRHRGSCGCGPPNSTAPFNWNMAEFVVAPSQKFFDRGGDATWCGRNCGACVKLTPTGGYVNGNGGAPRDLNSRIFMVTNDCPIKGNEYWCGINGAPGTNQVSQNGYEVHFDLQNHRSQMANIGWNNPEVTWEEVPCPGHLAKHYEDCECPRK